MKFIKNNKYFVISIVLILFLTPTSAIVAFLISSVTGFEGGILFLVSFLSVVIVSLLPYILSLVFNKSERQKLNYKKTLISIALIIAAIILAYSFAVPTFYQVGEIYLGE